MTSSDQSQEVCSTEHEQRGPGTDETREAGGDSLMYHEREIYLLPEYLSPDRFCALKRPFCWSVTNRL